MKILTLTQPWATLVMLGAKKVETRSWTTLHRGKMGIHAAKNFPVYAKRLFHSQPFLHTLKLAGYETIESLPLGVILGTVDLVGIVHTQSVFQKDRTPTELAFGDFSPGRFAWFLAYPEKLQKPIPAAGHLKLWEYNLEENS